MATTLPLALLDLESDSSETFAVENPATGETLAHLPRMGADETRRAIERANAALPAWRALLAEDRARILRRWANSMLEHQSELAELLTLEQGKPIVESHAEVQYGASFFEWFGEEAKRRESGTGRGGSKYGIEEWLEIKYLCMGGI
jgi:succinate-semialdehyde dehydrogenase/glutarate-semialdehyde dehydrogenase